MYTDIKYKFIRHVEALMIYIFLWTTSVCFAEEVILPFWNVFEFISWYFKRLSERHHTYFFIVLNLLILKISSQLLLLYFVYYIFFPFPAFWKVTVLSSEIISSWMCIETLKVVWLWEGWKRIWKYLLFEWTKDKRERKW